MSSARATLIKPPPPSDDRAPIEDVLELTHVADVDPNLFTNTRPLWHPPGARGIYGGAVIAQCLAAAQRTVPANFTVHSMHCYFVLNGNAEIPVVYHVEHVREGRSFATRTVQARQRGQPIFTTTLSFTREGSAGKRTIEHAAAMRPDVVAPQDDAEEASAGTETAATARGKSPFISRRIALASAFEDSSSGTPFPTSPSSTSSNFGEQARAGAVVRSEAEVEAAADSQRPDRRRTLQWIKARGRISEAGGHQAHLSALAYMSDSYFIGTVSRVHGLDRRHPRVAKDNDKQSGQDQDARGGAKQDRIGMMVSLDHTIYFHNPRDFRADEWMFTEMETPWAGDGRGLVFQRIFTKDGRLIASCVQEGLVRLQQDKANL